MVIDVDYIITKDFINIFINLVNLFTTQNQLDLGPQLPTGTLFDLILVFSYKWLNNGKLLMVGLIARSRVIMPFIGHTMNIHSWFILNCTWRLYYKIPKAVYQLSIVRIKQIIIKSVCLLSVNFYKQSY